MTSSTARGAVRAALLACLAAGTVAACSGSDGVASPGEGVFVPSPPAAPPAGPPAGPPPPPPPGGPAADCPTGFTNVGVIADLRNCQLPALITGALNVPKRDGTIYSIAGRVNVGIDMGADPASPLVGSQAGVISIDPGVTIFGSGTLDYMVVNRGSQIFAQGDSDDPIIMTSRQSILRTTTENSIGQWGGLVILGRAPTSAGCPTVVTPPSNSCEGLVEGTNAFYGGTTVTDNSGTLSFFRLMHSGFELAPNQELNGITLAGVGNGTIVENVQVHNSSDDGIEIFGGTVNVRNIVLTGNDDDSFDVDTGWRGAAQTMLIVQRSGGGDRGFEFSSAGARGLEPSPAGPPAPVSPFVLNTQPRVSNVTIVGRNGGADAITLNSGNGMRMWNSVVHKPGTVPCLDIDDNNTVTAAPTFNSVFMSCTNAFRNDLVLPGDATPSNPAQPVGQTETAAIFNAGTNNTSAGGTSLGTATGSTVAFVNGGAENGVTVTAPVNFPGQSFLTTPTNIGAVYPGNTTWYVGWTCSPLIGQPVC